MEIADSKSSSDWERPIASNSIADRAFTLDSRMRSYGEVAIFCKKVRTKTFLEDTFRLKSIDAKGKKERCLVRLL